MGQLEGQFGKYDLIQRIATGGMGEIYLARLSGPVGFEKFLVVKRLLKAHGRNDEFLDMFYAEARVAAQLSHPNIVQIYEMGKIEESSFIAMEYVHGKALRQILDKIRKQDLRIEPWYVAELLVNICSAMAYAHNATGISGSPLSIVHRDLTPHNILLSYRGDLKIIDFGIAKSDLRENQTQTGTIKGKFVYMSPEQSSAKPLDKRSDIFSIGICLYELLTKVNPFSKANIVLSLDAVQRKEPPPLDDYHPDLAVFEPIVRRALAKNREERYQDCSEMKNDLEKLLQSGKIERPTEPLAEFVKKLFTTEIADEIALMSSNSGKNRSAGKDLAGSDPFATAILSDSKTDSNQEPLLPNSAEQIPREEAFDITGAQAAYSHRSSFRSLSQSAIKRSRTAFWIILACIISSTGMGIAAVKNYSEDSGVLSPDKKKAEEKRVQNNKLKQQRQEQKITSGSFDNLNSFQQATNRFNNNIKDKTIADDTQDIPVKLRVKKIQQAPPIKKQKRSNSERSEKKARYGYLTVGADSGVRIFHNGSSARSPISLTKSSGHLLFEGIYSVKISYKVRGDRVYFDISSKPWSIVRGKGGIALGKTPIARIKGSSSNVFELSSPSAGRQKIMVKFSQK